MKLLTLRIVPQHGDEWLLPVATGVNCFQYLWDNIEFAYGMHPDHQCTYIGGELVEDPDMIISDMTDRMSTDLVHLQWDASLGEKPTAHILSLSWPVTNWMLLTRALFLRRDMETSRYARLREETEADPAKWQCWKCLDPLEDGTPQDTNNKSDRSNCWKCSAPRPAHLDREYKSVRWMCPQCSTDTYTIPGNVLVCPDCQTPFDGRNHSWWYMPEPLHPKVLRESIDLTEESLVGRTTGASGSAGPDQPAPKRKRRHGGKKHHKAKERPKQPPGATAETETEEETDDSTPVQRTMRKVSSAARKLTVPLVEMPVCQNILE